MNARTHVREGRIATIAAGVCTLAGCASGGDGPGDHTDEQTYEGRFSAETFETPDTNATRTPAAIEVGIDGRPVEVVSADCIRNSDEDGITITAQTRGPEPIVFSTGEGTGNLSVTVVNVTTTPTVRSVNIYRITGLHHDETAYVSAATEYAPPTGTATVTKETIDTFTIAGTAEDPLAPTHTKSFTVHTTCR